MQDERVIDVDALRGFALLGIFVVNVQFFASPYEYLLLADPNLTPLDRTVDFTTALLFESKFHPLFAFLFGYSFHLYVSGADGRGIDPQPRILRRSLGLFGLGLLHAILLFTGDVLTTYAVLGLVPLTARRWSDRSLAWVAASLVIGMAIVWIVTGFAIPPGTEIGTVAGNEEQIRAVQQAFTASPASVVVQNVTDWSTLLLIFFGQGQLMLAMMLLGLLAARHQVVSVSDDALKTIAGWGLAIGLPGSLLYAASSYFDARGAALAFAVLLLTAPFLTSSYMAVALLVLRRPSNATLRQLLTSAGRMALSNYLLQSLMCGFVFFAYGFGLMGSVTPLACLALVVAVFAGQLVSSQWWMRHHAYGPVEWLLRALTEWSWPRWQRS